MSEETSDVMDAARLWMLRTNEPDFANWDGLTRWLESDPRHLPAYEAALDEDDWAAGLVLGDVAQNTAPQADVDLGPPLAHDRSPAPPSRRSRPWLAFGGAIAAAFAGLATWTVLDRAGGGTEIETGSGEHRSIALTDGSHIIVNGSSRIAYDPQKPRMVTLDHGEALFEVRHDPSSPFVVMVGETRLIDIGTVFNVVHEDGLVEVSVAEGAVIYDSADKPVRLGPGDKLIRPGPDANVQLRKADPAGIGGWRNRVLQYDDDPLKAVARDLSRAVGKPIKVTPAAERMRYSGTLSVDGSAQEVMTRAGPLLGVTFSEGTDAWEMLPDDGASQ